MFDKPTDSQRRKLITDALKPFADSSKYAGYDELLDTTDRLFELALTPDELLHDDVDNPPTHHTTVLKHMMEICRGLLDRGDFVWKQVRQAAAISILHDICPVPRVAQNTIDRETDPKRRAELKRLREKSVPTHMKKGAKRARAKLKKLNQRMHRAAFTEKDINVICGVIAIHDNPKLKIPIPRKNLMAVAFREADRLWMVTPEGVRSDLVRDQKKNPAVDPDDPKALLKRVKDNIWRFLEERRIYPDAYPDRIRPFRQDPIETFFRTDDGFELYGKYLQEWGIIPPVK